MSKKVTKRIARLITLGVITAGMATVGVQPVEAARCCLDSSSRDCVWCN